ncbi:hypothetical protein THAOC_05279 [Thalassiosira oceanica]|uniref:Uncharacterized protein n=1 Tax=Thalassiosira oceanica TaxID=159749 RepID=K0T385_THAOC|nr:hypothetical protein THAOC_05279 [Thalassiosira oceanica]|eukprot:EJK73118.1 hypothetical protein THAOC_05279 [Thalassiosira oceanica]
MTKREKTGRAGRREGPRRDRPKPPRPGPGPAGARTRAPGPRAALGAGGDDEEADGAPDAAPEGSAGRDAGEPGGGMGLSQLDASSVTEAGRVSATAPLPRGDQPRRPSPHPRPLGSTSAPTARSFCRDRGLPLLSRLMLRRLRRATAVSAVRGGPGALHVHDRGRRGGLVAVNPIPTPSCPFREDDPATLKE